MFKELGTALLFGLILDPNEVFSSDLERYCLVSEFKANQRTGLIGQRNGHRNGMLSRTSEMGFDCHWRGIETGNQETNPPTFFHRFTPEIWFELLVVQTWVVKF